MVLLTLSMPIRRYATLTHSYWKSLRDAGAAAPVVGLRLHCDVHTGEEPKKEGRREGSLFYSRSNTDLASSALRRGQCSSRTEWSVRFSLLDAVPEFPVLLWGTLHGGGGGGGV